MAKEPSIDEALERAKRAQADRLNAIRVVAEARQHLADIREETDRELAELQAQITERVKEAERGDLRAYNAAVQTGWSTEELRKIGYTEPEKKARVRRRTARKPAATDSGKAASTGSASNTQTPVTNASVGT